jgi:hypothetical protein
MQEWHKVTGPEGFALLVFCILGVGFMVKVLVALIAEGRKRQSSIKYSVRLNVVENPASAARLGHGLDEMSATTSARVAEGPREQRGRYGSTTRVQRTSFS